MGILVVVAAGCYTFGNHRTKAVSPRGLAEAYFFSPLKKKRPPGLLSSHVPEQIKTLTSFWGHHGWLGMQPTKHKVWIRRCAAGSAPAVSPIVHARSAQVGIRERESRRGWGQQLVVRGQLHSPMGKLVMRVAHVAPIRAWCFNSKRTSFHVALELEHVESVDLRSAIRKADAVLPAFARAGQRGDTLKRVAWRGRCRLLFRLGVQHILSVPVRARYADAGHAPVQPFCTPGRLPNDYRKPDPVPSNPAR